MQRRAVTLVLGLIGFACATGLAQSTRPAIGGGSSAKPDRPRGTQALALEAAAVEPLVESPWVKEFVRGAAHLPKVETRTLYRDPKTRDWYTSTEAETLPPDQRQRLDDATADEQFYYYTKYGSPLAYARALDVLARYGVDDVRGRRILDFGYGSIGQLRLLATLGADVVGVDTDPLLKKLYAEPEDMGIVLGTNGRHGRLTVLSGRWPAEAAMRLGVGRDYDVILSKNTLKNGHLHPAEPVEERMRLQLGCAEDEFVRALFSALKPGGRVLIYNICPAPAPPGKPYIPWADGRSPFSKEQWEAAGFKVVEFNRNDDAAVRKQAHALGWDTGERPMDLENDLFALYTLVERPR